jgi:hypothetical protein
MGICGKGVAMCGAIQLFRDRMPIVLSLLLLVLGPGLARAQAPALRDTIDLYGGPDTLDGKFQDAQGLPDPQGWTCLDESAAGVGKFGQVWVDLDDADLEHDNRTPQWAFLDDGIVEECSGPSFCLDEMYCYGPDRLVTNQFGGCAGYWDDMRCSILSPDIALPMEEGALLLSFDAYTHNGPFPFDDPLLLYFKLEVTTDAQGQSGWQAFSDEFFHASVSGRYSRKSFLLEAQLMPQDAAWARIRLMAYELPMLGGHSTPGPYFDNVRLQWIAGGITASPPAADRLQARAYPNPFNPSVTLNWSAPRGSFATVRVHDLAGRLVADLYSGVMSDAQASVVWNGRDAGGQPLAAGMYVGRITAAGQEKLLKLTLVK